jgi:hypothetical protein
LVFLFLAFIDCGNNLSICICTNVRVEGFFNGVLSKSPASELAQSNFRDFAFQTIGKYDLAAFPVLDHALLKTPWTRIKTKAKDKVSSPPASRL